MLALSVTAFLLSAEPPTWHKPQHLYHCTLSLLERCVAVNIFTEQRKEN
jgi:hypothetical protein